MSPLVIVIFLALPIATFSAKEILNQGTRATMERLKKDLFAKYDRTLRPFIHASNKTTIVITVHPVYLDFKEEDDLLTVRTYLHMKWNDPILTWNQTQYENVYFLNVPNYQIWVPDLEIYNSFKEKELNKFSRTPVFLTPRGFVYLYLFTQFTAHCRMDLKKWPYDSHTCTAVIGSHSYGGNYVDFEFQGNKSVVMNNYLPNRSWKLESVTGKRNVTKLPDSFYYFVTLRYEFTLTRHSGILTATITIPAFVLVTILLLSFWMKPTNYGRLILQVISIIGHISYLQYLGYKLPPNPENNILIVNFFRDSLLLGFWTLVITIFTQSILKYRGMPPHWLHGIHVKISSLPVSKVLFFSMELAESKVNSEEGVTLVNGPSSEYQEWLFFAACVDRVHFILFVFIYLLMGILMIP